MFIAIRDLRFAWGRFLLMAVVVGLVAFLTTLLSGLASGLVKNNISGLEQLDFTHLAFEYGNKPSYRNSLIERDMWEGWRELDGVEALEPLGHSTFNARLLDNTSLDDVVLWGIEPGSFLEPEVFEGEQLGDVENGVIISGLLVERGLKLGDTFKLDRALTELKVIGVVEELNIGHVPIVYTPIRKWQEATYGPPGYDGREKLPDVLFDYATLIAMKLDSGVTKKAIDEMDMEMGTLTVDRPGAYIASTGYREEIMTVQMIQGFLLVISAVVIGAFFTVWTIQRTQEIGLVKALGASNGYLMRDALGQVVILMLVGAALGVFLALRLGVMFVESGFPFAMEYGAAAAMAGLLVAAGLIGSALSVGLITRVDPIIALGAQK